MKYDYTIDYAYEQFLTECMIQDFKMEKIIQEALILTEDSNDAVTKLNVLNEGAGDKIKELWVKFTSFIKKIFAKFGETMTKVIDSDKGWLEKYEKIIKQKPFKLDVKCTNYALDRINAIHVDVFNYSQLKDDLQSKSKFMHRYFPNFKETDDANDLNGWCKAYFCNGSEEVVSLVNPNMTTLYDFCHDFKEKIIPNLKRDEENIIKSTNNAQSLILTAINSKASKEKAENKQVETGNSTENDKKTTVQGEQVVSALFDGVLEAVDITPNKDNAKNTTTPTDNSRKFSNNVSGTKGEEDTHNSAEQVVASDNELTEEKLYEIINTYRSVAATIAGCKITICQWAYNDYMKILRAHVKMYVGDSSTPNQNAQSTTDYKDPNALPEKRDDGSPLKNGDKTVKNGVNYVWNDKEKKWIAKK